MTDEEMTMESAGNGGALRAEFDHLSLQQALVDFEVANARVLDLTRRLMESQAEVSELRVELDRLRTEHAEFVRTHEAMKSSQAFRMAAKIWALRNAVGR
jgi:hypothetical protein